MTFWNILLTPAVIALLAAIYCMAGEGDYQQALAEEADYCMRVERGAHRHWNEAINCPTRIAGVEQ